MAQSAAKLLSPRIVVQTGKKCTATVILLHGSGGTGDDMRDTFRILLQEDLRFPHIRFIYPTAPVRPYTLAGGQPSHVWFDRLALGLEGKEHSESVDAMMAQLGQLIEDEVKNGIPLHRIVVGGFSMGGAMALHLGYRAYPQVAGVLAMGCFLYNNSSVYKDLERRDKNASVPPLLHYHGEDDDLVRYDWGKATNSKLKTLGVKGEFVSYPRLHHSINTTMAQSARAWIASMLPEDSCL